MHLSDSLYFLYCAYQCSPLGVSWWVGLFSHIFTLASVTADSCPGIFRFIIFVVRHSTIRSCCFFSHVWSVHFNGWRASAHSLSCGSPPFSWGISLWLFIFDVFGGISEVVWGTWGVLPLGLILRFRLYYLGGLPLFAGLTRQFSPLLSGNILVG